MTTKKLATVGSILGFAVLFYISAYYSVSGVFPSSIPVHHDDYTNYAAGGNPFVSTWIRPFSTVAIFCLDKINPDLLTWSIRLLTVIYAFICWQLLTLFSGIKHRRLGTLIFATCVFSTPVIAEYARYTGMITHLISGTFGIIATLLVVRGSSSATHKYIFWSIPAIILSLLAKEDFILLYLYSIIVCSIRFQATRSFNIKIFLLVSALAIFIIGLSKFLEASSFLGDSNTASSYYINTSPVSVISTVYRYLRGADHPALLNHGLVTLGLFVVSAIIAMIVSIYGKNISASAYGVGAALAAIGPYSVLPNHVNAYYEFLWTPLIIGTFIIAISEISNLPRKPALVKYAIAVLGIGVSVLINDIDYQGRYSIANWYDSVGNSNRHVLQVLELERDNIDPAKPTCIVGADTFSPWYMHNGSYLSNNLKLRGNWVILSAPSSAEYPGFAMGAAMSKGIISTVASEGDFPQGCTVINLRRP